MHDRKLLVEEIRRFNRFYTRKLGFLNETLAKSPYSLTEARVLYEIGQADNATGEGADDNVERTPLGLTASDIAHGLGLDEAYLARIVRGFVAKGLVTTIRDPGDGRRRLLSLTDAGETGLAELQVAARRDLRAILRNLDDTQVKALSDAQRQIIQLLGEKRHQEATVHLRPHKPGDMGWVIARQTTLYAGEYGWTGEYEALACEICANFLRDFKPGKEFCWIAEQEGKRVGAVFLMRRNEEEGQLRLLHVEPVARGAGVGKKLVAECISAAKAAGYRKIVLWTNDVLAAARRIYEHMGFKLVSEEPEHSFGKDLHGQMWELDLTSSQTSN